jgi:hypothetical protein
MTSKLITFPAQGETTLVAFYAKMAADTDDAARTAMNFLVRSLIERGWLGGYDNTVSQLADEVPEHLVQFAVADLVHRRLLALDAAGQRFTSLLGSISLARTDHRGHLSSGVDVFTFGGMDLLALNPMLAKGVTATTKCGSCGAAIKLLVDDEQITDTEPNGIAGFQAAWDGVAPLEEVSANSPLFCSDACLEAFEAAHPALDGLPMSADLLLFVGMAMAHETGNARFKILSFHM